MHEGYVAFEDGRTWYGIAGELPVDGSGLAPLVVLHGGPGATHDYLLPLADLTRTGRAVVFYDQFGNGRSSHFPGRGADYWTVDLFVRELAGLLDHLGIANRHHLLGQSWGGMLAQEHVLANPGGVQSLVLSNSAASFAEIIESMDRLRAQLPAEVGETLRLHESAGTTDDPEYAAACDVFYHRHLCRLAEWPPEVVASFAAMDADPTVYHTMNGPSELFVTGSLSSWRSSDRLAQLTVPTLVVCGRYDELAPELQETLVRGITGSLLVVFEESSHMPMWEERDAYLELVGRWLADHDRECQA
jgi:L-proline amide hydrolase